MTTLATYWSMTINNPTETDGVLVRNPNDKYIRQLVWTPEVGEDGTPHVQAWLRLQRNQTLAFVKKLYPRGHFKPLTKEDYNENTHDYAQKNDETTAGHHVISVNDPLPGVDTILYRVLDEVYKQSDAATKMAGISLNDMLKLTRKIEDDMVSKRAGLEKLFISGTYDKMKRRFYAQILTRLSVNADDDEASEASSGVLGGQLDRPQEVQVGTCEGEEDTSGEDGSESGQSSDSGDSASDEEGGGD